MHSLEDLEIINKIEDYKLLTFGNTLIFGKNKLGRNQKELKK